MDKLLSLSWCEFFTRCQSQQLTRIPDSRELDWGEGGESMLKGTRGSLCTVCKSCLRVLVPAALIAFMHTHLHCARQVVWMWMCIRINAGDEL